MIPDLWDQNSATTPRILTLKQIEEKKLQKKSECVVCVLWSRLLLQVQEG